MRPEEYANRNLREALKFGPSPESVHDSRVALRKYYVVADSLTRLYYDPECMYNAREAVKLLGVIRDSDVSGCIKVPREELVVRVSRILNRLSPCELPKLYGSRLVVYEKVWALYSSLEVEDFHEFRKRVRSLYYLVESVGEDARELKAISRRLGDVRDKYMKETCSREGFKIPLERGVVEEVKSIVREILTRSEFRHLAV